MVTPLRKAASYEQRKKNLGSWSASKKKKEKEKRKKEKKRLPETNAKGKEKKEIKSRELVYATIIHPK